MLTILLVGKDPDGLADFAAELSQREDIKVNRVVSGKEAWDLLRDYRFDAVVTDEELAECSSLHFVEKLIKLEPLINCAMVSSLPPKEFHEVTEGLGIFMQFPINPGAEEAARMLQLLESIDALMGI